MPNEINMNMVDIVDGYLKGSDYDGLYNELIECACLSGDLFPCGNPGVDCQAGYESCCINGCCWRIMNEKSNSPVACSIERNALENRTGSAQVRLSTIKKEKIDDVR